MCVRDAQQFAPADGLWPWLSSVVDLVIARPHSSTASTRQIARTKRMRITEPLAISLLLFSAAFSSLADTPVHKCVVNGTVTFQQDPCPSTVPRRDPNIDRLNVKEKEEKKRREAANASASGRASSSAPPRTASQTNAPAVAAVPPSPAPSFRCDGRTHCSQMTSCSEAKFFLANCPRVEMDGDRDGTPCEQQWCKSRLN